MTISTNNEAWGLWRTCETAGMDTRHVWDTCIAYYVKNHNMTEEQARDMMDARYGRHLADYLSGIAGSIEQGLQWVDQNWTKWVRNEVKAAKNGYQ